MVDDVIDVFDFFSKCEGECDGLFNEDYYDAVFTEYVKYFDVADKARCLSDGEIFWPMAVEVFDDLKGKKWEKLLLDVV